MTSLIRAFRLGLVNLDFIRQVLLKDMRAGFVVGIIALPMSIGIALASGFPPFAGLVSSLIGGIVVSFFSGSRLGIKGPAGGLSALTLGCVMVLGEGNLAIGYSFTLAVIVVSGVLQILSAFAKMGNLGDFFPAAAIHGMLAALGFIMVVKQLPPLMGVSTDIKSTIGLLTHLPELLQSINPKVFLIGLGCLVLLIGHHFLPKNISNLLPAIILMLAIVVPVAWLLGLQIPHKYSFFGKMYEIDPQLFLVDFPADFLTTIRPPNFQKINTIEFWFFAIAFSLAGNIESLLTCKLIDQHDPWHRQSNFNRDLLAIGVGNILCGFVGGLPIISESKRSLVNIHLGAVSFASNFFHAFFLLILILFAQPFIRMIPVSALAAFLIYAGIKMTMPSEFSKSYKIGQEQFLIFVIVFIVTIYTNILVGVLVGTIFEIVVNMHFGVRLSSLFNSNLEIQRETAFQYKVSMNGPAIFSNFLWSKKSLQSIPKHAKVTVDFTNATVVDHSFLENLSYFDETRKKSGGSIFIEGLDYHAQVSSHPLAARRIIATKITPRQRELHAYAEQNSFDFDARRISNNGKYALFNISEKINIIFQDNLIQTLANTCPMEMADVHIEVAGINKQTFDCSVLVMYHLPDSIPCFVLQQEGFDGGLLSIENSRDINFDDYPVFSYYYYLTGEDESAIRTFFDHELLVFFEKHKGYHLNMADGQMLIYKRTDVLAVEELEKMRHFAIELISLLNR